MKNLLLNIPLFLHFMLFSFTSFGQAPSLGRVGTFALFTSAGAFGNTGNSVITGDIGTHVGALTGFPPGTVTGFIHIADSVTSLASTNLATAFASLSALTCGSTLAAGLGNGQTLTPNIYCITTAATFNGNLTLNAMGNPNAVFVIKVNGALTTGISSRVLLSNSASLNNVYWFVNGAFILGDSSIFRGTLIANGAISLYQKSSILGRGLTTAGAISIQNTSNVLPVKLLFFKGQCMQNNIEFSWSTASEKNNRYFTLESSLDQGNWISLARINGAGTTNTVSQYVYKYVNNLPENKYYRLKQTDMDGTSTYSEVMVVCSNDEDKFSVVLYPNPSSGILSLSYQNGLNQVGSVSIFNMLGTLVFKTEGFPTSINLSEMPNGIYFVNLFTTSHSMVEKIIIKRN